MQSEGVVATVTLVTLIYLGYRWFDTGGNLIAEGVLRRKGIGWLSPGWPIIFSIIFLLGSLLSRSVTLDYLYISATGSLVMMFVFKIAFLIYQYLHKSKFRKSSNLGPIQTTPLIEAELPIVYTAESEPVVAQEEPVTEREVGGGSFYLENTRGGEARRYYFHQSIFGGSLTSELVRVAGVFALVIVILTLYLA